MKNKTNNIIGDWLDKNNNPEINKLVEKNLAIANKIHDMLQVRGFKAADLARMLDKKPSEISKWLTGAHNFTTKTIAKIETVLAEDIIYIEAQKEIVYLTVYLNETDQEEMEETTFEKSEVFTAGVEKKVKVS